MVQTVLRTIAILQLRVDKMVDVPVVVMKVINIPFVAQRPFPMVLAVQQTIEISQLLLDKVSMFFCGREGHKHSCRDAEGSFGMVQACSANHRDSAIARGQGVDVPVVQVAQDSRCRRGGDGRDLTDAAVEKIVVCRRYRAGR